MAAALGSLWLGPHRNCDHSAFGEPLGSRVAGSGPLWSYVGFTTGRPHTSQGPGEDGQEAFRASGHGTARAGQHVTRTWALG